MRWSVDEYGETIVMVAPDARAARAADGFLADAEIVSALGESGRHEIPTVIEEVAQA